MLNKDVLACCGVVEREKRGGSYVGFSHGLATGRVLLKVAKVGGSCG